jgi:hypothetical protein
MSILRRPGHLLDGYFGNRWAKKSATRNSWPSFDKKVNRLMASATKQSALALRVGRNVGRLTYMAIERFEFAVTECYFCERWTKKTKLCFSYRSSDETNHLEYVMALKR